MSHSYEKCISSLITSFLFFLISYTTIGQDTLNSHSLKQIDEHLFFEKGKFSNVMVQRLVNEYPYQNTRFLLLSEYKKIKRNRRNRTIYCVAGVSIGLIGIAPMVLIKGLGGDNYTVAAIGASYFALGSVSIAISQICNYRYHQKKKDLIALYNKFQ